MRLGLIILWGNLVAASIGGAATVQENFSSDPAAAGWGIFGDAGLFQWNDTNQNLRVTWDSSRTNSYFHHPLPTILAKDDDFSLAFELRLDDVATGVDTNHLSTFEIAVALLNLADATRTNFFRGAGINSTNGPRNSVEFDYFPASNDGITATISPTMTSGSNQFATTFTFPLELTVSDLFHVEMNYTVTNRTLATVITRNGNPFGPIKNTKLGTSFTDFRLDTVAVCSYSDANQSPPEFAGSLLAHGVLDNILVTTPPLPVQNLTGAFSNTIWQAQFLSRSNWLYTLQRSADLQTWTDVPPVVSGNATNLILPDVNPPVDKAFYRVRANRP